MAPTAPAAPAGGAIVIRLPPDAQLPTGYNEETRRAPPFHGPAEREVMAILRAARAGRNLPPLPEEPRLSAAAGELARFVSGPGPGAGDGEPPDVLVDAILARWGLIEPPPHLFVALVPGGQEHALDAILTPQVAGAIDLPHWTRFGVGAAPTMDPDVRRVVLAVQESAVRTEPIPRQVPAGGAARVRGTVRRPYRDPELIVTPPSGVPVELPVGSVEDPGGSFDGLVACDQGPGRYQVEVVAEGSAGNAVLANFPIYCGIPVPSEVSVPAFDAALDGPVVDPGNAERLFARLLDRDRAQAGVRPLSLAPDLSRIARAHSCDMAAHHFVGHVSPTTGTAADRVAAAGIQTTKLLENVALAYSVREVERGLLGSPGHRANLLDPEVNQLGIGVCLGGNRAGRREVYVTEIFLVR